MFFKKKAKKTTHKAQSPSGAVTVRFSPVQTFDSPETRSTYVKDEVYFLREGNPKLKSLLTKWAAASQVIILED